MSIKLRLHQDKDKNMVPHMSFLYVTTFNDNVTVLNDTVMVTIHRYFLQKPSTILLLLYRCFLYGSSLFGSLGNNEARLMLFSFKNNISTRSKPIPPPPCGAHPSRNPST